MLSRAAWLLGLLFPMPLPATATACAPNAVLFVHPDGTGAYAEIVSQIRAGVQATTPKPVTSYALGARGSPPLSEGLARHPDERALEAVQATGRAMPILGAALPVPPDGAVPGVRVYINPDAFLRILSRLSPQVRRTQLVYRADQSAALLPAIEAAARRYDLALVPTGVPDLRGAVRETARILREAGPHEALWLHRGVLRLNPEVVLESVGAAWRHRIPVFSSEAQYVQPLPARESGARTGSRR